MSRRRGWLVGAWIARHFQVGLGSLGHLLRTPLASLMTVAVIGIALALPTGLLVLMGNLERVVQDWDGPASISLFLAAEVGDEAAQALGERIGRRADVDGVDIIGRDAALAEFREHSGFAAALDALDENPLPAVILVRPRNDDDAAAATVLTQALEKLPEVESAQLDLQWVKRLHGITEALRQGIHLLAVLLTLAVLLVIGNTIRLEILNRHEEIAICKLVGGTNAFVRRPFLYHGIWLGLLGGVTAWILVAASVILLDPAVSRLAELYHSGFRLLGPGPSESLALLAGGGGTGLVGAWIAVGRHLDAIEPS
jgi:cell division transport system permease protein